MSTDPRLLELARLRSDLERHDRLYYAKAAPEISDSDYDDLKDRYERLADELNLPAEEHGLVLSLNRCNEPISGDLFILIVAHGFFRSI